MRRADEGSMIVMSHVIARLFSMSFYFSFDLNSFDLNIWQEHSHYYFITNLIRYVSKNKGINIVPIITISVGIISINLSGISDISGILLNTFL